MKKIILIFALLAIGCSQDDDLKEPCRDCLVVVSIQNLDSVTDRVEMINECTGEERFSLPDAGSQTIGECYNFDR